ncbi:MAG: hypothetical protein K0B02_03955 [DPANN group archaeon]|nr:hypothetical protein [DPANN group archaeon]
MEMKFFAKKRKGVTPIIAIVLLLMMTVAAGGMAWQFIQSTMEQQQQSAEKELTKMSQSQLSVLEGNGTVGTGTMISFFIKNPGAGSSLTLSDSIVKINGYLDKSLTSTEGIFSGSCTAGIIASGSTCYLNMDLTNAENTVKFPNVGNTLNVEIISNTGQTIIYSCTPSRVVGGIGYC